MLDRTQFLNEISNAILLLEAASPAFVLVSLLLQCFLLNKVTPLDLYSLSLSLSLSRGRMAIPPEAKSTMKRTRGRA